MEERPNIKTKPALEKIDPVFGSSFSVKHYTEPSAVDSKPFWHFHPEIEMVYVKGGNGRRHIGNHLSYYQGGELVLIGSMLPHTGFTNRLTGNESETVIQFHREFLGSDFIESAEMSDIRQLFERAKFGIAFHGDAKRQIGERIEKLAYLDNFGRMIELLCILQDMAWTPNTDYEVLNAAGIAFEIENPDNDRINVIYDHVRKNFQRQISLDEISGIANMTTPAFCRYFKKISGKTFTRFVNEFRVVHACKLLTEKQITISQVCFESGFNNFSHFNRLFKSTTGKSPSEYRKQFMKVLQVG